MRYWQLSCFKFESRTEYNLMSKMRDFSPINLLFVTGASFLLFSAGMRFLDGSINYFLLNIGLWAFGLGCFFSLLGLLLRLWEKKNSTGISTDSE